MHWNALAAQSDRQWHPRATSVRQWLPTGERITILPTLTGHIVTVADETSNEGRWECSGGLFDNLMTRVHHFGPHGCRAILWHQGESDANQSLKDRTLPGKLYAQHMETIIKRSRTQSGWNIPWFIAQASYHTPDDPGSEEIRSAQKSLWQPGLAHEGPDTDTLTGDHRDGGGKGVHFSAKGLNAHGQLWAEKVESVFGGSKDESMTEVKCSKFSIDHPSRVIKNGSQPRVGSRNDPG